MILCTGRNYELGYNNQLLGHYPEDLKYFKETTQGCTVVMGNNTFKSLPFKDGLPNRKNIVLTSEKQPCYIGLRRGSGVKKVNDVDKLIEDLLAFQEDVFIIGGANVYEQFKDVVQEIHWSMIDKDFPNANVHFDIGFVRNALQWEKVKFKELSKDVSLRVYKKIV